MKITLRIESNTDQGQESAEYRFYLVFEKHITQEQISVLFNKTGFQCPEIVKKDDTLQGFLNKRIPEPLLKVEFAQYYPTFYFTKEALD